MKTEIDQKNCLHVVEPESTKQEYFYCKKCGVTFEPVVKKDRWELFNDWELERLSLALIDVRHRDETWKNDASTTHMLYHINRRLEQLRKK